jgi:hypothetical protein
MQMLFYALIVLAGSLSIAVGSAGCIVGLVAEADVDWGWKVIVGSILYLVHPALLYWLFKKVHETLAMWLTVLSIVASSTLILFS